jgi:hypothetical protein
MKQDPTRATGRRARRATLALLVALASNASVLAATSVASDAGGADEPRPATFGDCKNANEGVHNGYDCEVAPPE